MNINNNKGITLIALIITIIIILIISSITVYVGSNIVNEAKFEDVKTNMLLLQAEVKNFVEQAKFEKKEITDFTGEQGIKNDKEIVLKLGEKENNANTGNKDFYKITSDISGLKIDNLDLQNYLVSIDINNVDVDVYYKKGIKNENGDTFYLLSAMLSTE